MQFSINSKHLVKLICRLIYVTFSQTAVKMLKIGTPQIKTAIVLNLEQFDFELQ